MPNNILPAPQHRTRPYPAKLHIFLRDIRWHVLSKNGQQYHIPDEQSLVRWVYEEYLRKNRNYRAVEIFHSIQSSWLGEPFGQTSECVEVFARIISDIFPQDYGYRIQPARKFCGYCRKVKLIEEFAYSYSSRDKKKRYCKPCEASQSFPAQSKAQELQEQPDITREDVFNALVNPLPSATTLDKLDNISSDPDFSPDRLGDLE